MATKLQNLMKLNGQTYELNPPTDVPTAQSNEPISSNYMFNLVRQLNGFLGKSVTNVIEPNNNDIPTSAVIYEALSTSINVYAYSKHIMNLYQQNVLFDFVDADQSTLPSYGSSIVPSEGARTNTGNDKAHDQAYYAKYRVLLNSTYLCRFWPNVSPKIKISHGAAKGEYWKTYGAFHLVESDNEDKLIGRPFEPLHNKEIYLLVKCKTNTSDVRTDYVYGRTSSSSDASTYKWTYYGITITGFVLAYWDKDKSGDDKFVTIAEYPVIPEGIVPTHYDTVNKRLGYMDMTTGEFVPVLNIESEESDDETNED